jgi:glycosyltransferase involved in cell wall biosynthesis
MQPTESAPLVSVVIPVYNGARYLNRSVSSALAQTFPSREILVVDDGSTDATVAIAQEFGDAIRLVRHEKNRGLPAARNTGIQASRGQFIALFDSDDWWEPEKLAEQMKLFKAAPAVDVVFCDFLSVEQTGGPGWFQGGTLKDLLSKGLKGHAAGDNGFVFEGSVANDLVRHLSFMHPSTVVVRRGAFDRVGLFNEEHLWFEDLEMWIRLAVKCQVGMVDRNLVWVELRSDSMGHRSWKLAEYWIRLYKSLDKIVPNMPPDVVKHARRVCAQEHLGLGWYHRTQGDGAKARQHYVASLGYEFRFSTLLRWCRAWWPERKPARAETKLANAAPSGSAT